MRVFLISAHTNKKGVNMCTSLTFQTEDFYFGRNMDLDYHFGEGVVVTPRNYNLNYKHQKAEKTKYAIIGMATIQDGFPLYAEGINEKGLCISALNFEGNACYGKPEPNAINLAPYEIIPYILSKCDNVENALKILKNLQITSTPFNEKIGVSALHWHIADKKCSITIESTKNGLQIYDNSTGVLTNNPPFDFHLKNLLLYNHLTPKIPHEKDISLGASLYGLPGDFSSPSRFVKLSILKRFVKCESDEKSSIAMLLRLMLSVSPLKGTTLTKEGKEHYTTYTCIANATKGIYHYLSGTSCELKSVSLHQHANDEFFFNEPL